MQVRTFRLFPDGAPIPVEPGWDGPRTLVLAFFASELGVARTTLEALRSAYPGSHLAGASTGGEIVGTSLEDNSIAVAVLHFASTELALGREEVAQIHSSLEAGRRLARHLDHAELKGALLFTSGLAADGADAARGLSQVLGREIPVSGGVAAAAGAGGPTFTLSALPGEPLELGTDQIIGIGFRGRAIRLSSASKGGWSPFGLERRVTRSQGHILYELDGKPALALYRTYLGERARGLPLTASLFPLAILDGRVRGEDPLVRSVQGVDEEAQSLIFGGNIQEGSLVQLMHSSVDRLVEASSQAGASLAPGGAHRGLCLAVSCIARRLVMGERAEEELEALSESLSPSTDLVGFYSHGELSPERSGECLLHNQTMTLTLIQEV
nr:FIST N-terminal domain-containing protein [uncultured Holophaga sp.]